MRICRILVRRTEVPRSGRVVKINQKFQALHLPDDGRDWVLVQKVERDICLLYRQLAGYSYIMGDLYYGTVYELPYWNYLDLRDVDEDDRRFLRDGCLVMILAMAWDMVDGSGAYLAPHIAVCRSALEALPVEDERTAKLVHAVREALESAEAGAASPELDALSSWAHEEFVKGYFRSVAQEFETNPYYRGAPPDDA